MVIPITSQFSSPTWPVQKTGGSWRMTVGYRIFIQTVTAIAVAVTDAVSLLKQMNTSHGSWFAAVGLTNAFSSILANYHFHQKQFAFSRLVQQCTFTVVLVCLGCHNKIPQTGWLKQ